MTDLTGDDIKKAWDRIARTADGLTIYRHFQKVCLEKPPSLDGSALPFFEGRRSLAFDMMANMSEGIADNDRSAVTFAVAKPTAIAGGDRTSERRAWLKQQPWDTGTEPGPEPSFAGSNGSGSNTGNT